MALYKLYLVWYGIVSPADGHRYSSNRKQEARQLMEPNETLAAQLGIEPLIDN